MFEHKRRNAEVERAAVVHCLFGDFQVRSKGETITQVDQELTYQVNRQNETPDLYGQS